MTETKTIPCSEQIQQLPEIQKFLTNTQWHPGKAALGWNTVLAPLVTLVKEYVKINEARVAYLEAQLTAMSTDIVDLESKLKAAEEKPKKAVKE